MMNPKSTSILTIFTFIIVLFCANFQFGLCSEFSSEIESIARFAVEEHNKQQNDAFCQNTLLKLGRVLKAKEQVVAGKIYHLTLEAIDAGRTTVYEAKVWVKPWMNFKQLQEFKLAMNIPHYQFADLRFMDGLGWHNVSIHDPEVQIAANHAVKVYQERLECLCPSKLQEIVQAKAEVVKDLVKYNLLLTLNSDSIEQKVSVILHRTADGSFHVYSIERSDH